MNDLTKEELIKILKKQDLELQAYEAAQEEKIKQSKEIEIQLLEKQRELEVSQRQDREVSEQKSINLIQKFASEANIKKSEIEKTQTELEAIDRQLVELVNKTKKRVSKLAGKFVDLSREKANLLTKNQVEIRNTTSDDIKLISRYYDESMKRNQAILEEEIDKEKVTQKNIAVLTRTIDLSLIDVENDSNKKNKPQQINKDLSK